MTRRDRDGVRRRLPLILTLLAAFGAFGCKALLGPADPADPSAKSNQAAERALQEADVAAARGRLEDAAKKYQQAGEALPDDPRVLDGLARVRIAQQSFDEAVALDDRATAIGEPSTRALAPRERCDLWLAAASARVEASQLGAGELLDRIDATEDCAHVEAGPVRAQLLVLECEAALAAGDEAASIEALRAAIEADPDRVDLDARLGRALLDAEDRRAALRALSDGLERHAEAPELQALMLEALGLPKSAVPGP